MKQVEVDKKRYELETAPDEALEQLLFIMKAAVVDNDKTMPGSEVSYKSVWEEDELAELKSLIMKKARKL